MYFHSRSQAGRMLAAKLADRYRYENCSIVAIDNGGVVVGAEIAKRLHCSLSITVSENIDLPLEPWAVGGVTLDGQFVYNNQYSKADLYELEQENRGYIEEQKLTKMHAINRLMTDGGVVDKQLLVGQNIIMTSDGLTNSFKLDLAVSFVKTVKYERLILATPLASINVVDWMHLNADEIYCLSVIEDLAEVGHYYDVKDIPDHQAVIKMLNSNILNWK